MNWQGLRSWNSCQDNMLLPALPIGFLRPQDHPFLFSVPIPPFLPFPAMKDYSIVMLPQQPTPPFRNHIKVANCLEAKMFNSLVLPNLKYKPTCFIGLECFQHDPISVCVYSSKLEKIAWLQSAKMSAAPFSLGWSCQFEQAASKLTVDRCCYSQAKQLD